MNCENAIELMNAAIDGEINSNEKTKLERHLEHCETCTIEFEELKYLVQVMGDMDLKTLPVGFEEELHEKLVAASYEMPKATPPSKITRIKKAIVSNKWQYGLVAAAVFVLVFVASGQILNNFRMGSGASDAAGIADYESSEMMGAQETVKASGAGEAKNVQLTFDQELNVDGYGTEYHNADTTPNISAAENGDSEVISNYRTDRLIIYSGDISLQLENYDAAIEDIKSWVENSKGYVESTSTRIKTYDRQSDNLKYGDLVLRIPVDAYSALIDNIKSLGLVVSESTYADDVTKQYRDTANSIENLKITEARLRDIMTQATDVSDVLEIENELTRIRGEINRYEKQIKDWEALADLATVYLSIEEVDSLTPSIEPIDNSLGARAREAFVESINTFIRTLESIFIWIVSNVVRFVVVAILVVIGYLIYKTGRKK